MSIHSFIEEILPGIEHERPLMQASVIDAMSLGTTPASFPLVQWNEQIARYSEYWWWWQGRGLEEIVGESVDGHPLQKYPVRINRLRTIARLLNAMVWGHSSDDHQTLIRSRAVAEPKMGEDKPAEADLSTAKFATALLNHVWDKSNGRTLLHEGGLLQQFLGGVYYQLLYQPWRKDSKVPIYARLLKPDFVMPVPNPDNPWDLQEAFIVYRITPRAAEIEYGLKPSATTPYVTYIEHWTRTEHSIYIDGKPIIARYQVPGAGPVNISYDKRPNPFGFVPIVYIPRLREGNFYGSSLVPDILGVMRELNMRVADLGDLIEAQSDRIFFGRNLNTTPDSKQFYDGSRTYVDLGKANGMGEPEIWGDNPPDLTQPMIEVISVLQDILDQEAFVAPVAKGKDEGSQRSGETLEIRMNPTVALGRSVRTHWTIGKNVLDRYILLMVARLNLTVDGKKLTEEQVHALTINQVWNNFLPREEAAETQRLATLRGSGLMSLRRAVASQPDVDNVEAEVEEIRAEIEEEREYAQEQLAQKAQSSEPQAEKPVKSDKSDKSDSSKKSSEKSDKPDSSTKSKDKE